MSNPVLTRRVCPVCSIEYAIPAALYESARITGEQWTCPNGHKLRFPRKPQEAVPTPPLLAALEAENKALRARCEALEADCSCALDLAEQESEVRRQLQHRLTSAKSRARSLRRTYSSGVCPWCKQGFENLRAHLAAKHQGFIQNQRNIA